MYLGDNYLLIYCSVYGTCYTNIQRNLIHCFALTHTHTQNVYNYCQLIFELLYTILCVYLICIHNKLYSYTHIRHAITRAILLLILFCLMSKVWETRGVQLLQHTVPMKPVLKSSVHIYYR